MVSKLRIPNENKPDFICNTNGEIVINCTENLNSNLTRKIHSDKSNNINKTYESKGEYNEK
jgi:hypothetical protein